MEICPQTAAKARPRGLYVVKPGLSHLVLHLSSASKAKVQLMAFTVQCTVLSYMHNCTANEGLVRIQYKYLVTIYVFPEMKLCSLVLYKKRIKMFCLPVSSFLYL
jgi:hypothetical protein